ncbi:citrate lyase holo-[acyl-carrier protein] synthase [Desulfosporosinus youngiae]|uniref:Holo-ACP synthase CitX n=1 Tax=Desulfosporosinus youngiae DSM 17734 TaxID=768710 RepID=H5Y021_9FIRM|nr:citrate lyase holo-[acyl-carrier protein] synthase [Desulfosporosinus youngiae]EHQ91930.1 holo-ACP synthase CitX [Desulfosporosinus youngiae DSM 17734]
MKEYTAGDLLEAREKRAALIESLLKRYNTPLLVMRVNYPGLKKTNDLTVNLIKDMTPVICTLLQNKIWSKSVLQGAEGPIFYAAVNQEAASLKKIAIGLEEDHSLGRCLDIDVYDSLGKSLSRQELGYPSRKCYLCAEDAHHCVRSRRHRESEVIQYIKDTYQNYKKETYSLDIAGLAVQAMLYEVSCSPSPGLVSKESRGAHQDMDYFTFLDSAASLIKPLIHCAKAGFSPKSPEDIFLEIRRIGQVGEQQMLQKTSGVNTCKGMFFLLGICCAAGGKALYSGLNFSSLQGLIKEMTKGLVERELRSRYSGFRIGEQVDVFALTHGERLFLNHKVEGIRGEVERGLPTVFDFSLGFYKENQGLSQNSRLIQTLLAIMQHCEDSTILHRHSFETLKEVQDKAGYILSIGGVKTLQGLKGIEAMNEDFCKRNISPGGSADLLGVTVFLYLLEEYMESKNVSKI